MKWFKAGILIAAMVFSASGSLLWAHHSIAGYDIQKEVAQRAVIKEFNWKNPHVYVVWEVKDRTGKVTEWAGELASPTTMIQLGMNRNSLKPGDEVIMTVNPSRTGSSLGLIKKITMADGKLVVDRTTPN